MLLGSCWKRGSASKPTKLHQMLHRYKQTCCIFWNKYGKSLSVLMVICGVFLSYYFYLVKLYLLDETYDIRGPKELQLIEKLTIRVYEPVDVKDLNKFVLHYSICPCVHEIQVIWHSTNKEAPQHDSFKYTTTHSKVSFHKLQSYEQAYEQYMSSNMESQTNGK